MGYALVGALLVGSTSTAIFAILWYRGKAVVERWRHVVQLEQDARQDAETRAAAFAFELRERTIRLEGVIRELKIALRLLEDKVAGCHSSPDAVRDLLRTLAAVAEHGIRPDREALTPPLRPLPAPPGTKR